MLWQKSTHSSIDVRAKGFGPAPVLGQHADAAHQRRTAARGLSRRWKTTTSRAMLYEIAPEYKIKIFEETGDVDFGYEIPNISRFRANFFNQKNGIARRLPPDSQQGALV